MAAWSAFDEVEPLGLEKLCSILARGFSWLLAAQGHDVKEEQLMPWRAEELPEQTIEEQKAACQLIAAASNAQ